MLGEEKLAAWRETGSLEVFHYGAGATQTIGYGLYEDALGFPAFPDFRQPALIFHGTADDVVPVDLSRQFVADHANAELTELNSGHELTDVLETILGRSLEFLLG